VIELKQPRCETLKKGNPTDAISVLCAIHIST